MACKINNALSNCTSMCSEFMENKTNNDSNKISGKTNSIQRLDSLHWMACVYGMCPSLRDFENLLVMCLEAAFTLKKPWRSLIQSVGDVIGHKLHNSASVVFLCMTLYLFKALKKLKIMLGLKQANNSVKDACSWLALHFKHLHVSTIY